MSSSRRELLKASGAGLAAAAAGMSFIGAARAQVAEETGTDPMSITRMGINKDLVVISADIL
jgi:hypothetical protein